MIVTLKNKSAIAQIDSKGAELISYKDVFGTEYMWQKDPKYWAKTSPVLFPIVGNLRGDTTIIDGREYHMSKHGFCRTVEFKVTYQSDEKAIFTYTYNDETLAMYPYKFSLTLTYSLSGAELQIQYSVMNLDERGIDYTFGAHPGFNVPVDGNGGFEDYCLEFDQPETAGCPVYDFDKNEINMSNRADFTNGTNKMMLKYSDFDNDAIMFDQPKSSKVKLYSIKTGRGVEMDFGDFDFIAFWTPIKMDAPFLCMEPWCGMAVCSDEGDEFAKKRGCKHLPVGEQHNYKLKIMPL